MYLQSNMEYKEYKEEHEEHHQKLHHVLSENLYKSYQQVQIIFCFAKTNWQTTFYQQMKISR